MREARYAPGTLATAIFLVSSMGCGGGPLTVLEKKPIAEVAHQGFRLDIPDERRGNAVFYKAVFTREGNYLVTAGSGFRVWNPHTGALLKTINGTLDSNDVLVADGTHHRLLARRGDVAPSDPLAPGLGIWDLRDGSRVGMIPETDRERAVPVGVTATGEAVVFRERNIETWALDGSGLRTTIAPPEGLRFCERGNANSVTYNDKQCWELSPSGRFLAVTAQDPEDRNLPTLAFVADLQSGELVAETPWSDQVPTIVRGFAFSTDEQTLAIGVERGMWIRSRNPAAPDGDRRATFVAGQQQRSDFLTPMSFTANNTRLVALGDQLQISTFDVATGALIGRVAPPFEDREGALRVSADGSRAIAYRFVADILVVIDGGTGKQRGYLCPFFCNRLHSPVEVPYAVSPDGKRVASGGRLGAGLWNTDADTLIAPLEDPVLPPRRPR